MPALQVRDFPEDLYDQLKAHSALNHRSMAQQTVAFVEAGLQSASSANQSLSDEPTRYAPERHRSIYEPSSAKLARKKRRAEVFSRIDQLNQLSPATLKTGEDIAGLVRSLRDGRTEHLTSVISKTSAESAGKR